MEPTGANTAIQRLLSTLVNTRDRARETSLDSLATVIAYMLDRWDDARALAGAARARRGQVLGAAGGTAVIAALVGIGIATGGVGAPVGSAPTHDTAGLMAPAPMTSVTETHDAVEAFAAPVDDGFARVRAAGSHDASDVPAVSTPVGPTSRPASAFARGGVVKAKAVVAPKTESARPAETLAVTAPPTIESAPAPKAAALAPSMADPAADAEIELAPRRTRTETLTVRPGDTLAVLLDRAGLDRRESHNAVGALRKVFNPRHLKVGHQVQVAYTPPRRESDKPILRALSLEPEPGLTVAVSRATDGGFEASKDKATRLRQLDHVAGTIDSSLYVAARDAGLPTDVLADMILTYSFDVDFQRDIRVGDTFEVMYERYRTEDGTFLENGNVLFAVMTVRGKPLTLYRYVDKDGFVDYYDAKGRSVRKALLRTPINGARLSSSYGKRKHPILGYTKMHTGIDFAAPPGTPIFAAGNGTVAKAGWNGGYGRYVKIRHNGTYSTAYAHMKGIAKGVRAGARVRQGQVIGYVGTTGRSTGPHLHYEVMINGKRTNPLSVRLPAGKTLKGAELASFHKVRTRIDTQLAEVKRGTAKTEVASAE